MKHFLILLLISFFYSSLSYGLTPRRHKWIKLKTPHFTVITPKDYKEFGQSVAKQAERAHDTLQLFSKEFPKNTMIIVDPTKDYANGQASFFPYATITLQPAAPSPSTSIGQYDDWLYELLLHEYTHILSFHNHRGIYRPLRWFLGSSVSPGYFLPVWYLEGLAVFNESYLTSGGRLRSSRYRALQKIFSNSKKVPLAQINEQDLTHYPFGQSPYFFGSWLNKEILSQPENAQKIHKKLSGRIPFFISSAYKSVTQKSLYKVWKGLFSSQKTPESHKTSKSKDTTENENSDLRGVHPQIQNDEVFYIGKDAYQTDEIKSYHMKTGKIRNIARTSQRISQFKVAGEDLYFLSLKTRKNEYQVFELYKTQSNAKKIASELEPLTYMLRARHFDILKEKLLYSKINIRGDQIYLSELSATDQPHKLIYKPSLKSRITFPQFLNKDEILFAEKTANEEEKIFKYNLSTQHKTQLFKAEQINSFNNHLDNVFILSESKGKKYYTNLNKDIRFEIKPEVLSFDNSKSFWASQLTLDGPKIVELLKDHERPTGNYSKPVPQAPAVTSQKEFSIKQKKYSSLNKIRPYYVIPNFLISPYGFSGEFLYGLGIGGSDPLRLNQYSVSFFTDTITEEVSGSFNYLSNHFSLPLSLSAGKFFEPLNLVDFRESSFAQIFTQKKLSPNSPTGWSLGGGLLWDDTSFNTVPAKRLGANLNVSYSNTRLRARELAPRSGFNLRLSSTYYADVDEEYTSYLGVDGAVRKFFRSPLSSSHRLMLGADVFWSDDLLLQTYAPNSRNTPLQGGGFVFRGLPTGALLANEFYGVGHLEYSFPLLRFDWGPGLWPVFLKRATGALVADFGVVSGTNRLAGGAIETDQFLSSVGIEMFLETKISYHVPIIFQFGAYQFLDTEIFDEGPEVFIGVNLSGLPF